MTSAIFSVWLKRWNNQLAGPNRKILLLLDNCNSHIKLHLSNIDFLFLSPNTTDKLQPLDAGIIQTVKLNYRKMLMRHLLRMMNNASTASGVAKQVSKLVLFITSGFYF